MTKKKNDWVFGVQIVITLVLAGILFLGGGISPSKGIAVVSASEIIPTGIPLIYGDELGVSYDGVSASNPGLANQIISKLKTLDNSINLEGADLERYIGIVSAISCEYCCGAKSIIFDDGRAACGCAHSYAMRGVAKYLITQHGDEFSDEEILAELGKWKILFFPGIHENKAAVMKSQGIDVNYISLTSNQYRGIEKGQSTSSGMVGGC